MNKKEVFEIKNEGDEFVLSLLRPPDTPMSSNEWEVFKEDVRVFKEDVRVRFNKLVSRFAIVMAEFHALESKQELVCCKCCKWCNRMDPSNRNHSYRKSESNNDKTNNGNNCSSKVDNGNDGNNKDDSSNDDNKL